MFPTLCDVCYDSDAAANFKFDSAHGYRLSRTVSPSSVIPSNYLAPYLLGGPQSSRCTPSPDPMGRHSVAGAAPRSLVTPSLPVRRSKTTIGHYGDGLEKSKTSLSSTGNATAQFDERSYPSRSRNTYRSDHGRLFDDFDPVDDEKLVWVDGLRRWVVEDSDNVPYFSFVNTAMLQARAATHLPSTRDKPSASIDLCGRFQAKAMGKDSEKRKWRVRRGFLPPKQRQPTKSTTSFITVKTNDKGRPSKTILRQKTDAGQDEPATVSSLGKHSATGSHRVHFEDEIFGDDGSEFSRLTENEDRFFDFYTNDNVDDGVGAGHVSRSDSAFESANGSRLSMTDNEDVGNEKSEIGSEGFDEQNDADMAARQGDDDQVRSRASSAVGNPDSPVNISPSPVNIDPLSDKESDPESSVKKMRSHQDGQQSLETLDDKVDRFERRWSLPVGKSLLIRTVEVEKCNVEAVHVNFNHALTDEGSNKLTSQTDPPHTPPRVLETPTEPPPPAKGHTSVDKGARSRRKFGGRSQLNVDGEGPSGRGRNLASGHLVAATSGRTGEGTGENSSSAQEADNFTQVTKDIASVRLDNPPNLELVVDSEAKGAIASRPSKPIQRQRQLRTSAQFPSRKVPLFQPKPKKPNLLSEEVSEEPEPEEETLRFPEPKVYVAPPLPALPPTPPPQRTPTPEEPARETEIPLLRRRRPPPKPRWGPRRRDQSYMNELKDAERYEKARKLAARKWMKDKTKSKDSGVKDAPRFEQYGFLSKYCILNHTSVEMFRRTFDAVDDEQKGWLTHEETLMALRGVNQKLKDAEKSYLYRVLELCGYNVRRGADFKLFAVLSALSQRITSLDDWMRNQIGRMDFKMLEMKMALCKHLWECNVDRDTNRMSIDQLCVELHAGGVSEEHIKEVRNRVGAMRAFDLLDFLTYIPLFIMLHTSIVTNPLDDSRTK